jgi:Tfp pilus assembly protein PilZ
MTTQPERRKHPRLKAEETITVRVLEADGAPELVGNAMPCALEDLSVGGLRFRADRPVPVGGLIKLGIVLRRLGRRFDMQGRIVWMVPGEDGHASAMGVHFTAVGRQTLNAWRHALKERKQGHGA